MPEPTKSSAKDNKYKDLPRLDEPLILQHGGKLIRDYVDEALHKEKDYDFAALLMNSVTNAGFTHLFEEARSGNLGVRPRWTHAPNKKGDSLEPGWKDRDPEPFWEQFYCRGTLRVIDIVKEYHKGLAPFLAVEGQPTDLRLCGQMRLRRALKGLDKHPTFKYVLQAVAEITSLHLEMDEYDYQKGQLKNKSKPWLIVTALFKKTEKMKKAEKEKCAELIDSFEDAVFTGDLDWFRSRYGDEVIDIEDGQSDPNDDDYVD